MSDQSDPYAPPPPGSTPPEPSPYGAAPQPPPYGAPPAYGQPSWGAPPVNAGAYASWGRRVGGRVIDWLCVVVPSAIIGGVAGSVALYDVLALVLALSIAYMNGATGQSPGKRVAGTRLLREATGEHIGGGMGIVREIAHLIDTVTILIGWLWPLWDKKRQTFADKIVGSVVVLA